MLDLTNVMKMIVILLLVQPTISSDWVPLTPHSSLSLPASHLPPTPTISPATATAATCRQRGEQTRLRPPSLSSLATLPASLALLGPVLRARDLHTPRTPGVLSVSGARPQRAVSSLTAPGLVSRLSGPGRQTQQERDDSQQDRQPGGQP